MTTNGLKDKLREATHAMHVQLNHLPLLKGLMEADYTIENYHKLLEAYALLYQDLELKITRFITEHGVDIDYDSRLKAPLIYQDLAYLSRPASPIQLMLSPDINSIGALIGVLYVVEGSTLGGQHIARALEKHHGLTEANGARFFYGYGEATPSKWVEFISYIESIADQPEECAKAIDNALKTFELFVSVLNQA